MIARVHYFDPYYLYTESFAESRLLPHEAYGYVQDRGDHLVVSFIESGLLFKKMVRGLLIPKGALASEVKRGVPPRDIAVGDSVMLTWQDIVHVNEGKRDAISLMQTTGTVASLDEQKIIIARPNTVRISPKPQKDHPARKPTFYAIPFSLIMSVAKQTS